MSKAWQAHIDRLKSATVKKYQRKDLIRWIEENTYLKGRPFSFKNHEYTQEILLDTSKTIVVAKPSQVGMSETVARYIVGRAAMTPLNIIYVLPTASFAGNFAKDRVSPIINESPYLSSVLDSNVDNSEMKRLGHSLIMFRGSSRDSQAISTPADVVISDEYTYSDETIVKQYQSRLNHSPYKEKLYFSTPLLPTTGISGLFSETKQHYRMVKCNHCNHWSWPDLPHDIRIPGVPSIDWSTLTKSKLSKIDYSKAYIACPNCGKEPDYSPKYRQWVCKNTDDTFEGNGYAVSPFDVPLYRKAKDLVAERVEYNRYADWMNTSLGLPFEDETSGLSRAEVEACFDSALPGSGWYYVMGLDMGSECHCTIWACNFDGAMVMVHAEAIPAGIVADRYKELERQFHVRVCVADAFPYTETIIRMQAGDPNLWASVYVKAGGAELYKVKQYDEKPEVGRELVRQVNICRDTVFDAFVTSLRAGLIRFAVNPDQWKETILTHFTDMKRTQKFDGSDGGSMRYVWEKSNKGEDHLWHSSAAYAHVASKLVGTSQGMILLPTSTLFSFKRKNV